MPDSGLNILGPTSQIDSLVFLALILKFPKRHVPLPLPPPVGQNLKEEKYFLETGHFLRTRETCDLRAPPKNYL